MTDENDFMILVNRSNSEIDTENGVIKTQLNNPYFQNKQLAVTYLNMPYSWNNISDSLNNRTFSYIFNTITRNVELPETSMEITDINDFLEFTMFQNGDYLLDDNANPYYFINIAPNPTYYKTTFTFIEIPLSLPTGYTNPAAIALSGTCPQIQTDTSDFNVLLGIEKSTTFPTVITDTIQVNSPNVPDVKSISTINLSCNFVHNSIQLNNNIFSFTNTDTSRGAYISPTISYPLFIDIDDKKYQYLEISLLDQLNRPIAILDDDISVTLFIRDKPPKPLIT